VQQTRAAHERAAPLSDVAQKNASQQPTVLLWQGERNHDGRLSFLYWPVMGTLLEGFRHARCATRAGVGFSLRYHRELARLSAGDTFIWVGINGVHSQPWAQLRRRRVRVVWYQTEPTHQYALDRRKVDEIWDFSWHNMEAVTRRAFPCTVRFVPPGYLHAAGALGGGSPAPPAPPAEPDAHADAQLRSAPPEHANSGAGGSSTGGGPRTGNSDVTSDALLFLGAVQGVGKRERCWGELKRALGGSLQATYAAWDEGALARVLSRHDLFLNLHKGCESGHAPVTFRAARVLSAGRLLLSERAHPRDEAAYDGLITFAPLAELPAAYRALRATSDRRRLARGVFRNFTRRFAPRALFEAAGVYRDWRLRVGVRRDHRLTRVGPPTVAR
tara:strand:+ start:1605 stop:2765 length:1161 start_codon:yes stop_codon:yes gene_type:complete